MISTPANFDDIYEFSHRHMEVSMVWIKTIFDKTRKSLMKLTPCFP